MNAHILGRRSIGLFGLALAITLGGCAKKREYEEVFKERVQEKASAVDVGAEYIYVPSEIVAPRSSNATRPGAQGTERIVKFRFTEKTLVAEAIELDPRFADNPANAKPVLTIPIENIDYRCADNGAGECSNKEEVVDDKNWKEKKYFRPDFDGMSVQETNTLPIELSNLLSGCQTEIGARIVNADLGVDAVNIEVERTYRAALRCLDNLRQLDDVPDMTTFNVRLHYSFLKREKAVSKDYAPLLYPALDENTFGFFKKQIVDKTIDNRDEEKGVYNLMNRWNPARTSIPYHLSANFAKPEHARVLEATKESIDAVNAGLAEAGVKFRIELKGPSEKSVGDARNSMIVMVEDPQDSGVIGYGPAVSDPRTGEILSARTIMYLGTMKKFVRETWEDYVAAENAKEEAAKKAEVASPEATKLPAGAVRESALADSGAARSAAGRGAKLPVDAEFPSYEQYRKSIALGKSGKTGSGGLAGLNRELLTASGFRNFRDSLLRAKDLSASAASPLAALAAEGSEAAKQAAFFSQRTRLLAKFAYPAEYLNTADAIRLASLKELRDVPRLEWAALSPEHQRKVIDAAIPYVWVTTLVHELGHNLGLRHNFAGSEDKEHFYSESELAKHGHPGEPMIYSSVMDYGYNDLNKLRVMGKYDVAALKFAYARKLGLKDGKTVDVQGSLAEMQTKTKGQLTAAMESFKYCTDENRGVNPTCRVFDEGSTMKEIAKHLLADGQSRYWKSNFRNGRLHFSDLDDIDYLVATQERYRDMRQFFELYDRIWSLFGGNPELDPEYAKDEAKDFREFYTDLKGAVSVARDALMRPILEPDAGCLVAFVAGPNEGKQTVVGLKQLGGYVKDCFQPYVLAKLEAAGAIPIASYGKSFRNQKSPESTNGYVDQIDTRGIWGNKLLAVDELVNRWTGMKSWDEYRGNYLDSTTFRDPVIDPATGDQAKDAEGNLLYAEKTFDVQISRVLEAFLLNDVTAPLHLTLGDGSTAAIPAYNFYPEANHWIPRADHPAIKGYFGLPNDEVPFAEMMLSIVLRKNPDTKPSDSVRGLADYFGAKGGFELGDDPKDFLVVDLGDGKVLADKKKNLFAAKIMTLLGHAKVLAKIDGGRIDAVISAAKSGKPDPKLSKDEQAAAKVPLAVLEAFKNQTLDDPAYYELVLRMLVRANLRS